MAEEKFYGYRPPDQEKFMPSKPKAPNPGLHLPPGAYVPDYKTYSIKVSPELMDVQRRLHARGLHSPWLRNDAWRYDRSIWGSEGWRRVSTLTLGWRFAFPALIVTAIYEFVLKKDDDHGHGHGHAGDHH